MSLNIPKALQQLEANCGVFAVWMLLQHHGFSIHLQELIHLCKHDPDHGTYTIDLAIALKKLGFEVNFCTDPDPYVDEDEAQSYMDAAALDIPVLDAVSFDEILNAIASGKMAIVFYDTEDGAGNQSLVYSIESDEICFFDHFEVFSKQDFETLRSAEGICRQVILIDDQDVNIQHIKIQ